MRKNIIKYSSWVRPGEVQKTQKKAQLWPGKRDVLKQWHLPTQHFQNPTFGPQTALLNEEGIYTAHIQSDYSWNACTQGKAQSSFPVQPQQSVQPQTEKKEKTRSCSPSSRQWRNFISTAGKKSRRETSGRECKNFAPSSTRDAYQGARSSSASRITFACFTVKCTSLVTFTHSFCSFLGRQQEEASTTCSKRKELPLTHTVKEQGQSPPIPHNNTTDCLIQIN